MTILQIPVSMFSKNIIESENRFIDIDQHPPVIYLRHSDTLFLHLCCIKPDSRVKNGRLDTLLTETIHVAINDNLAAYVHPNLHHLGFYLNEIHREKLNEIIWWEVRELHNEDGALQAKQVIERFCHRFKIQLDIEVNYETLYRAWTRYKQNLEQTRIELQKNALFFRTNGQQPVRQKCEKTTLNMRIAHTLLSDEQLNQIIMDYFTTHEKTLFRTATDQQPRKKLLVQLKAYVYNEVGQRPINDVAKRLKMTKRKAYYQVASFRSFLLTAPALPIPEPMKSAVQAARQKKAVHIGLVQLG